MANEIEATKAKEEIQQEKEATITLHEEKTIELKPIVSHPTSIHDPSISFEEFRYWAAITREDERHANTAFAKTNSGSSPQGIDKLKALFFNTQKKSAQDSAAIADSIAKADVSQPTPAHDDIMTSVSEEEWKAASRAFRTASWGSCFYLIIADVINMFSTPWAFAQTGYGPGIALYTVFGALAGYSAWIMWVTFLGLDSDRYPLRTYGDVFFRLLGPAWRHATNISMSLQMLLFVAALILLQGQSISQISQGHTENGICFVACLIIFMAAGMILTQIRSLHKFAWVASFALWINLVMIFICVGVVVHYPPNVKATESTFGKDFGPGPILTFAGQPPPGLASGGEGFVASLNGLNQAVLAYSGCLVFVQFMAEMRHPMDFWKAIMCAQVFIWAIYLFFGIYIYSFQGQFSFNPVMQGLSPYGFQTAANILSVLVGLISSALYGNVGFKVIYIEVFQGVFGLPPLTQRGGRIAWMVSIPVYFIIAFAIAGAIPQFAYITGFIGALFGMTFTYTMPGIMAIAYWLRSDAMVPDEKYDPQSRTYSYIDTGLKRWTRAFMKRPVFHIFNTIYVLGSIATTVLGVYASVIGLIDGFSGKNIATSFGCTTPV